MESLPTLPGEPTRSHVAVRTPQRSTFARWCVFQALVRRVPESIRELVQHSRRPTLEWSRNAECFDRDTELALSVWAQKWGLPYSDAWWMEPVRATVNRWRECPEEEGRWPGMIDAYRAREWPTLQWRATEETERDFKARVRKYIAAVKALSGIASTPGTFTERHFEAFVLEHAARQRVERIPRLLGIHDDPSTIRKRNHEIARLLGLRLRRHGRGRPYASEEPASTR